MKTSSDSLRCLVACGSCLKQYDATTLATGSRFHCSCGEAIEVPRFLPHDAAVVRCSSCGAPRTHEAIACEHCAAEYTVHERDMHTICASCMTRISDRARFCHHCATPVQPHAMAGTATRLACPVCGRRRKLTDRALGAAATTISECHGCAGVWLDVTAFRLLADRARDAEVDDPALDLPDASPALDRPSGAHGFYRKCPRCSALMNRRNFAQRSGVVIDACKEHGIWFDASELGAILRWIRKGGEGRATQRREAETRHRERLARLRVEPRTGEGQLTIGSGAAPTRIESLPDLLSRLFDL